MDGKTGERVEAAVQPAESGGRLTEKERLIVQAVILRILPSDDGPGARETRAHLYVLKMLETRSSEATIQDLRTGLRMLEELYQPGEAGNFVDASAEEQDLKLRQLQLIPHPTIRRCFHRLVTLTLEGFLCNPQQEGNFQALGWTYLGLVGVKRPDSCKQGECTTR